jgi:hypothetical protein
MIMANSKKILPKPTSRKTVNKRQKRINKNLEIIEKLSK